jgi:integrase
LGTSDLRTANDKARVLHAELAQKFATLRAQDNPQMVALNPELLRAITAEIRRGVLLVDDNMRDFPEVPALLAQMDKRRAKAGVTDLRIPKDDLSLVDPLAGLSEDERVAVARFNAKGEGKASLDLASRNLRAVLPIAEATVRRMGLLVDWTNDVGRAALLECLRSYRTACADVRRRDQGEAVDTPEQKAVPELPQESAGDQQAESAVLAHRIGDALERWLGLGVRKAKTISVFTRHVGQFKDMTGDPLLSDIGRAQASKFTADLQRWAVAEHKTRETADNVLASIKALTGVAVREGWIPVNPFAGMAVEQGGKESEAREPWTPEELPRLFASPVFNSYSLPQGDTALTRKAGLDAAYWVPLLCLYTGARPGEVCQLWTDDVSEVQDSKGGLMLVLEFRQNVKRGQSLKNPSSWRVLPIHTELIRLGLRDYWQSITVQQGLPGPLFPAIPKLGVNGPGGQFGQWFGAFKKAQGFSGTKTLHSFRHTVETELGFADVPGTLVDAITGHEGSGIGRKQYGATIRRGAVRLRPTLERLQFPGLNLPRVFKAPVWKV